MPLELPKSSTVSRLELQILVTLTFSRLAGIFKSALCRGSQTLLNHSNTAIEAHGKNLPDLIVSDLELSRCSSTHSRHALSPARWTCTIRIYEPVTSNFNVSDYSGEIAVPQDGRGSVVYTGYHVKVRNA